MADFRFLHAADIHLDSPLRGLARYDGVPLDEVRGAARAAFDRLVAFALEEAVDFLVIAGDLFDGDWKDMGTGVYLARQLGRLSQAGIPLFVIAGNHDAAAVITKNVPWPDTVKVFGHRKAETHRLEHLGVAVHGQSFATQHVYDDLAQDYPSPESGMFNVGVLHTSIGGYEGHAAYAPCTIPALQAKGYDYWALGHVHDLQVVAEAPHIVFSGNLQGRNIRETGAKGAVLVEVRDRTITHLEHVPLDVVRWARAIVDCTGCTTIDAVHAQVRRILSAVHGAAADGRPLVVRLVLQGETPVAGAMKDRVAIQRDELRALAAAVAADLWLEKIVLDVRAPTLPDADGAAPDEFMALLAEAAANPELAALLAEDLRPFVTGHPRPEEAEAAGLAASAAGEDWLALVRAAAETLPARLTPEQG